MVSLWRGPLICYGHTLRNNCVLYVDIVVFAVVYLSVCVFVTRRCIFDQPRSAYANVLEKQVLVWNFEHHFDGFRSWQQSPLTHICHSSVDFSSWGQLSPKPQMQSKSRTFFYSQKFFRRGLRESHIYFCKKKHTCRVNPRTRNECRFCRFQKCLIVGMSKSGMLNNFNISY